MPDAASITPLEVLGLLDGPFSDFSLAFRSGEYAVWLGAGISKDRVPDLGDLVVRVLEYLRSRADLDDPTNRFCSALHECLGVALLNAEQKSSIDFSQPVAAWPVEQDLRNRLTADYSKLLNVRVHDEEPDFLLWDAVDVRSTYAPLDPDPDCEHLCLALLMAEGVLPTVVSANWDGLIEAGISEVCGADSQVLKVCITPDDLPGPVRQSTMYKIHGCAVHARDDPENYRQLIVGRDRQIIGWTRGLFANTAKSRIIDIAATSRTLMIGMSAQDSNLQFIFAEAAERGTKTWPATPPTHVFSGRVIGPRQRSILEQVFGPDYDTNRAAIDSASLMPAYSKPLLVALVLDLLASKLVTAITRCQHPGATALPLAELEAGVRFFRDQLAAGAAAEPLIFTRALVLGMSESISLFRDGRVPDDVRYRPLSQQSLAGMATDTEVGSSGLPELGVAIATLGAGASRGYWELHPGGPGHASSRVIAASGSGETRLYFVANSTAAARIMSELIDPADEQATVIVNSHTPIEPAARSARNNYGRSGGVLVKEVGIEDLLSSFTDLDSGLARLREELGV